MGGVTLNLEVKIVRMPVGALMSARNAARYSLIITVFVGFPVHFGKYIHAQVIGVLYGYNKFDYVYQYVK